MMHERENPIEDVHCKNFRGGGRKKRSIEKQS